VLRVPDIEALQWLHSGVGLQNSSPIAEDTVFYLN
jgi:hypothetical protein